MRRLLLCVLFVVSGPGCISCSPCFGVVCPSGVSCDSATGLCGSPTAFGCSTDTQCATLADPTHARCDTATKFCVGCLKDGHCPSGHCDAKTEACAPPTCATEADCAKFATTKRCDPALNICVGCTSDVQCGTTSGPRQVCAPLERACVVFPCTLDADCAGDWAGPRCDIPSGRCQECSADADCTGDKKRCDVSRHACTACLADADCAVIDGYSCKTDTQTCTFGGCVRDDQCGGARCDTAKRACKRCLVDADCTIIGGTCADGACVSKSVCATGNDCAFPSACADGSCVQCGPALACRGNQVCKNGSCAEPVACGDSTSCLAGRSCQAGMCADAACVDDAFAPNQSAGSATGVALTANTSDLKSLVLCPNANDWFSLAADDGDGAQVELHFSNASAAAAITLLRATPSGGLLPVGFSEVAPYGLRATAETLPAGRGPLFVQVHAPGDRVEYELIARTAVRSICADDFREPDDSSDTASALLPGSVALTSCPGNDDWFRLDLTGPERVEVTVAHAGSSDDLELDLYDATGTGTALATGSSRVTYTAAAGGPLYLDLRNKATLKRVYTLSLRYPPMPPVNDACAGAVDVAPGSTVQGTTAGASADGAAPCAAAAGSDVYYKVSLPNTSSVTLDATAGYDVALAVWKSCGGAPVVCAAGAKGAAHLAIESLPAGDYFIGVASAAAAEEGAFALSVATGTPTPPPPNATCATAAPLAFSSTANGPATAEASAAADISAAPDSVPAECAPTGSPGGNAVYSFELTEPQGVLAAVSAAFPAYLTLRQLDNSSCSTLITCAPGTNPALGKLSLAAGRYALVVDGGGPAGGPFSLDTKLYPAASNDTCTTAAPLTDSGTVSGDTRLATHNYAISCAAPKSFAPDVAFSFTLAAEQGVHLALDATYNAALEVRALNCTDPQVVACNVQPATTLDFPRLAPGVYYVVVSSYDNGGGPFALHFALRSPATPPPNADCAGSANATVCDNAVPLTFDGFGNAAVDGTSTQSCDGLHPTTCTGGALSGPDVTYSVTLLPGQTLSATMTPSGFDGALYLVDGCGATTCLAGSDKSFLSGGAESISYTVPATAVGGTYLLGVDSFSPSAFGAFHLSAARSGP